MSEFEPRAFDDAPPEICSTCAAGGLHFVPMDVDLVHCEHTPCGAYRVASRPWKVMPGVERGKFREAVALAVVKTELRLDLQHDLEQLLKNQADDATKH